MSQSNFNEYRIDYSVFPKTGNSLSIYVGEDQRYTEGNQLLQSAVHRHSFYELHYVLEGEICYRFLDNDCVRCPAGNWIIVLPQVTHSFYGVQANTTKSSYQFGLGTNERFNQLLGDIFKNVQYVTGQITEEILELIKKQNEFVKENNLISSWIMKNNALNLILNTVMLYAKSTRFSLPSVFPSNSEKSIANLALKFIEDNADHRISSEDVIYFSGVYKKKLNRIFQEEIGKTISECIAEYRLKYAKLALETDEEKNIREISEKLDFGSVYYFSRFFKQHTGMTPNQYRQELKKHDEA